MAKEILFVCDPCQANGEKTTATHVAVEIALGQNKPKLIDLCDTDYDALVLPIEQALEKFGYTDEPKRKRAPRGSGGESDGPGPYQCGLCPATPAHRKAFSNHTRQVHSLTLTQYIAEHGEPQLVQEAATA